tara:strand:+ start:1295 stop:2845 length:1551 start_codon:yes stop_codon:yes gene_type:complete
MTTDWSKTWAGANGWYDGYDSTNTGSFVDINSLSGAERDAAITAVRENIIGLLEQKGVTRAQILDPTTDVGRFYQTQMDNASGGAANATRDAFQAAAQHTTSNVDRGNTWGADDDATIGRTFLDSITADSTASISDLYTSGFGRAADQGGLDYWQAELDSGRMNIQQIAQAFSESEEANIRDVYADEYGRDADAAGLQYWRDVSEGDDSDLVRRSVQYRGDTYEQAESSIRDAGWEYLGQASNEAQRSTMPTLGDNRLFTAMENTDVVDWVEQIQRGDMTLEEVIGAAQTDADGNVISGSGGILYNRGDYMDAHNQYDVDDWDEDGANPTGMGRFASLQDVQAAIDAGQTPDDVRKILAKTKWGALTHEKLKNFGDHGTSQDLYNQAVNNFTSTYWKPEQTSNQQQGDWTPTVPDKGSRPPKPPVDRREIDYLPNQPADQFSSTPYGAAKDEFNINPPREEKDIPKPALAAQRVGQRFTGTSAKGVALKRSKRSKLGTIRGTKQLGREQQTQSLNI